ncbi:hypothetical protein [Paraburkholderia phosphatilytica]|uniref:hypothetical protein n=1 Tax=Paraburkholderia phosphatilytica TaxID=2282883 RepID=UPI000E4C7F67|nr:hypothetical protein [Paraburkholderia phosphatilytica]
MSASPILTSPEFLPNVGVRFSAYAMEWGFCSFVLTCEAACEKLGAGNPGREQVLLAFQLNRQRIAQAVGAKAQSDCGERIVLDAADFA